MRYARLRVVGLTGVCAFIDGHNRRELVQDGAGLGNVRGHRESELCREGHADSGSHRDGSGSGKGDESGRQGNGYRELHHDVN